MKKLLCLLLVIILAVSLTSCNKETAYTLSGLCLLDIKKQYTEEQNENILAWQTTEVAEAQGTLQDTEHAYIITIYRYATEEENGELAIDYWFCEIAVERTGLIRRAANFNSENKYYYPSEVTWIDCDWYKTEIIPSRGLIIEEGKSK